MKTIEAAKIQYGALQATMINKITGNTSYTKRDMKQAMEENKEVYDDVCTKYIPVFKTKLAEHNHIGNTREPKEKYEQYIVARAAGDDADFDNLFDMDTNKKITVKEGILTELQRAFDSYFKCENAMTVATDFRNLTADINDPNGQCPRISFEDFCRKAAEMEARKNNENPNQKVENAIYRQKTREEIGWDNIHEKCKKITGYGFTCYPINEQKLLNDVAHDINWCVAKDGHSGLNYWKMYGGGPYYLICRGGDVPFILMHARSHQFKGVDDSPFKTTGTVDRPSRAKIFQFAIDVLNNEAKEWDGEYVDKKWGYKDFQVLKTVPELDVANYDFLSLLSDPNCPSKLLQEAMKQEKEEDVANAVAQNEQCPYRNLVKMATKTNSTAILVTIARNPQLDDNLAELLLQKNKNCAFAITQNPKCSQDMMKKILDSVPDPTDGMKAGYLAKDYCPVDFMWQCVNMDKGRRFLSSPMMYNALLSNPKAPKEILDYVINQVSNLPPSKMQTNILSLCYKHPNCAKEKIQEKLKALKELKEQYNKENANNPHPAPFRISPQDKADLEVVLKNPNLSDDIGDIRDILAQVTNMFYKQPDHAEILMSVAENPNTPPESINKIVGRIRQNIDLATALVKNPNCPYSALDKATKMLDSSAGNDRQRTRLLNAILRNRNCTEDIKNRLLYRKTFENIRDTIFPEKLLIPLCTDEDEDIRYIANIQLNQVYKKQVLPDGTVVPLQDNKRESSINRIATNIAIGSIAFRIASDYME